MVVCVAGGGEANPQWRLTQHEPGGDDCRMAGSTRARRNRNGGRKHTADGPPRPIPALIAPGEALLRKTIEELLDRIVTEDAQVTRREDQLEQLCNVLLLKLESDRRARASAGEPPEFRSFGAPDETARELRRMFVSFAASHPEVFRDASDKQLRFADDTLARCVASLAPMRLADMGVSTMSVAFQVFRTAALKQGEGQYFTPRPVIEAGVRLLDIGWNDVVIDPACGTGGFLVEVLMQMHGRHPERADELGRWAQEHVFGIDKDAIGVKLTRALLQMAGEGAGSCVRGDAVRTHLWRERYPELCGGSYDDGRFSVVLTNPPFGVNLKVSAQDARRAGLDLAKGSGSEYEALEIGLMFLQRAHQLLRVGGRLGIILPETYFFSDGYRFVLEWLRKRFAPKLVVNVPMEAFQGFCRAKTNFYVFEKLAEGAVAPGVVVMMNPGTCGIDKDGGPRFRVDAATGERSGESDNELGEQVSRVLRGGQVPGLARVDSDRVFAQRVLVPRYYDNRWTAPFERLCRERGWRSASMGELEQQGTIQVRAGHGSPGNDMRSGHIPYVKVSDLRSLRVNVNPTNLVSEAVARSFWRGPSSGLLPWDLITPVRASSNIGEFAILLPGEEQVVLTREVAVLRVGGGQQEGWSPFYLFWALCLRAVRLQWQRVTLMQTNREDAGKRYREIRVPVPRSRAQAEEACEAFRVYFTSMAEARGRFREQLGGSGLQYIASALPSGSGGTGRET